MSSPTGTDIAKALVQSPEPVPIKPVAPVPTYPGNAPPGSPEPTPQPVYQTANPNSFWGMNPMLAAFAKFGFGGVVVVVLSLVLNRVLNSQSSAQQTNDTTAATTQKALLESFSATQKERAEEVKALTTGILATQASLQSEIHALARVIEKLEAKLDNPKKEDDPKPPAVKLIGPPYRVIDP